MTICAAQITLQYLTSYKSDLEYSLMEIGQRRQVLAYRSSQLASEAASDPEAVLSDDPVYQAMAWQDKQYEQQQKTLETQQAIASSQIESYKKLVESNIKNDFSIKFGGGS